MGEIRKLVHRRFGHAVIRETQEMDLGRALADIGGTTYENTSCRKQGDGAFKPWTMQEHETG